MHDLGLGQGASFLACNTCCREKPNISLPTHKQTLGDQSEIIYSSSYIIDDSSH